MGDSGALLLGFTLASVSVEGLLKTAALATLVLPLLVLAVPLLDTSFVVAKRIKHGQPIYFADRTTSTTASRTSASRSAARSSTSTRGARRSRSRRSRRASSTRTATATGTSPTSRSTRSVGLLALGASLYVVYLLEIVKLANPFIRRREEQARAAAAERRVGSRLQQSRRDCAQTSRARCHELTLSRCGMLPADGAGRAPLVPPCRGGRDAHRADSRRDRRGHARSAGRPVRRRPGSIVGAVARRPRRHRRVYGRYRKAFS